jgi:hypothetical protein
MKMQLVAVGLLAITFGVWQLPAQADEVYFGRSDRNHDGRWDNREFYNANRYYGHHHPEVIITRNNSNQNFMRLDRNHDGWLDRDEVQGYRHWE